MGKMSTRISAEAANAAKNVIFKIFCENPDRAKSLEHGIFRLAREFEASYQIAPEPEQLYQELNSRLDANGRITHFFNEASRPYKTYPEIHRQHLDRDVSEERLLIHDLTFGNTSTIDAWFNDPANHVYSNIFEKIKPLMESFQLKSVERCLSQAREAMQQLSFEGLVDSVKNLSYRNHGIVPDFEFTEWQISKEEEENWNAFCGTANELDLDPAETIGLPELLTEDEQYIGFNSTHYKNIRNFLSYEIDDLPVLNKKSYIMSLLFPRYSDFTKYCERWPSFIMGDLYIEDHMASDSFSYMPFKDYEEWGEAALHYGPAIMYYLQHQDLIGDLPRGKGGQISLTDLKENIYHGLKVTQPPQPDPKFETLRRFIFDNQLSEKEYNGAKYLIKAYGHFQKKTVIPSVTIDGKDFGMPDYTFKELPRDDYRSFFPGKYTACCERLFEHCRNSVVHAYKTQESSFYVLTDPNDRIIAHSFVWKSANGFLVFDGFESRQNDKRVTDKLLNTILNLVHADLGRSSHKLQGIALGVSGKHLTPQENLEEISIPALSSRKGEWVSERDEKALGDFGDYIGYSKKFFVFSRFCSPVQSLRPKPDLD